jgi:hypothetical protein
VVVPVLEPVLPVLEPVLPVLVPVLLPVPNDPPEVVVGVVTVELSWDPSATDGAELAGWMKGSFAERSSSRFL